MLAPALASGIDKLRLAQLAIPAPVYWLEVSPAQNSQPTPASLKVINAWIDSGAQVSAQAIAGDSFWATQEITECPNLLAETLKALETLAP